MRPLILLLILFGLAGCCQLPEPKFIWAWFNVTPYGERQSLTKTRPQSGQPLRPLDRASFQEITLAQGGAGGDFQSVRIFADGSGYVVAKDSNDKKAFRMELHLSANEMSDLIAAARKDRIHNVPRMLASDLSDGAVGFVQLVTVDGSISCWMSNYFERVSHLYDFCNEAVWPKVIKNERLIVPSAKADGMAEYRRIFKSH